MKGRRLAVHADICDASAGTDQCGGELERRRKPDSLDGDVTAEILGDLPHGSQGVVSPAVDDDICAKSSCCLEPDVGQVNRDDVRGAEELRSQHRGQPDRACADDRDHVSWRDVTVEHTDLVARREGVGQHQEVLVTHAGRDGIR